MDRVGAGVTIALGGLVFAAIVGGLGLATAPAAVIAIFLSLGLVAGLTESAERALVARLAPVRSGRGFGSYHGLTGFAALPSGLLFGALYQRVGATPALLTSAAGTLAAVVAWIIVTSSSSPGVTA